jgi:hypothetical protein
MKPESFPELLPLDSPRWNELSHAYGPATDTATLLLAWQNGAATIGDIGLELHHALVHQGDAYDAAYAATPRVISLGFVDAERTGSIDIYPVFVLIANIELARQIADYPIPEDLRAAYHQALLFIPELLAHCYSQEWTDVETCAILKALAAIKKQTLIAQVVDDCNLSEFEEWLGQ